jgi:single-strand DNA-binding protein
MTLCEIGIAVNSTQKNKQSGDWEDEAHFFNVTFWGRKEGGGLSETVAKFCSKGDRVAVTGRLQQQRWEGDNGAKRERVSVVGSSCQFLTTKGERDGQAKPAPAATEEVPF